MNQAYRLIIGIFLLFLITNSQAQVANLEVKTYPGNRTRIVQKHLTGPPLIQEYKAQDDWGVVNYLSGRFSKLAESLGVVLQPTFVGTIHVNHPVGPVYVVYLEGNAFRIRKEGAEHMHYVRVENMHLYLREKLKQ